MMVDVHTSSLETCFPFVEAMQNIGVEPRSAEYMPLPFRTKNLFVVYFKVYDEDATKVEQYIDEERWAELFHPEYSAKQSFDANGHPMLDKQGDLLFTAGESFIAKAISVFEIMEAVILSAVNLPASPPYLKMLLADKKYIRKALENTEKVEYVKRKLSARGRKTLENLEKNVKAQN